jgi:hypothetical protein
MSKLKLKDAIKVRMIEDNFIDYLPDEVIFELIDEHWPDTVSPERLEELFSELVNKRLYAMPSHLSDDELPFFEAINELVESECAEIIMEQNMRKLVVPEITGEQVKKIWLKIWKVENFDADQFCDRLADELNKRSE